MVSTPTKQPDNNGNGTPQPAEDTSATDNSHDSHDDSHNDQYSTPTDRKLLAGDLDDDSITSDREITFKNGPNARYNDSKTHQDEMDGIKDSIRLLQQNLQQSQATAEGYQASVDALADMMTNFIANNGQAAISPPAPPRQSAVTVSRSLSISDNLAMSTGRHPCDEDAIRAFFNKCTDILNDIDYTKIAKLRDLFAQDLGAVGKLPTGSSADRIKWAADFLTRLQDAPLLGAFFSPAVMGPLSLDIVALNPTFWESLGDFLRQNALSSMDRNITTALKNTLPDEILTAMITFAGQDDTSPDNILGSKLMPFLVAAILEALQDVDSNGSLSQASATNILKTAADEVEARHLEKVSPTSAASMLTAWDHLLTVVIYCGQRGLINDGNLASTVRATMRPLSACVVTDPNKHIKRDAIVSRIQHLYDISQTDSTMTQPLLADFMEAQTNMKSYLTSLRKHSLQQQQDATKTKTIASISTGAPSISYAITAEELAKHPHIMRLSEDCKDAVTILQGRDGSRHEGKLIIKCNSSPLSHNAASMFKVVFALGALSATTEDDVLEPEIWIETRGRNKTSDTKTSDNK